VITEVNNGPGYWVTAGPRPEWLAQWVQAVYADHGNGTEPDGVAGPAGPPPWSKEPIDFSGLSSANGKAIVTLAKVKYRNLVIAGGRVTLDLEKGVMNATVEKLKIAGGTVDSKAVLDGSGKQTKLSYRASVVSVQARPLLKAMVGFDRLSGTATTTTEWSTAGRSEYELAKGMNGKGSLKFVDGAIHGVNIAAILRQAKSFGMDNKAGKSEKTDFAELSGTYVIKNGVIDNRNLKMLAPALRLSGAGLVPMPPQTLDYGIEVKLVATSKGQGGKDALAGLPISVRASGTWQKPVYKVDWDGVFKAIAADPERLANMSGDLGKAASGMGIKLPGGAKTESLIKGLTGGGKKSSAGTGSSTAAPAKKDPVSDLTKNPAGALKSLLK
jgi:AsmA protein